MPRLPAAKESQILALLQLRWSVPAIAAECGVSPCTVRAIRFRNFGRLSAMLPKSQRQGFHNLVIHKQVTDNNRKLA